MPETITTLEIIATICGLVNVYLLTKEKVTAWPFGIASVSMYAYIFFSTKLYSNAILHVVYFILNIYGWYNWSRRSANAPPLSITRLQPVAVGALVLIILIAGGTWGCFMKAQTDSQFPFFDAFIMVTSLVAQYLLAKKKIENWVLWILVDILAIPIYALNGLLVTSGLYVVYLLLSTSGLISWYKTMKQQLPLEHS